MLTVELVREKETKNKVRYEEIGDQGLMGNVYMPKVTLSGLGNPDKLLVTIDALPKAA